MSRCIHLRENTTGIVTCKGLRGFQVMGYRRSLREMVLMRHALVLDHGFARDRALWRNGRQRHLMSHYTTLLDAELGASCRVLRRR